LVGGGLPELVDFVARQMILGIEYIQIREKDLSARQLYEVTTAILRRRSASSPSKILMNDRADVALAAHADGVHLAASAPRMSHPGLLVARSCHTIEEAASAKADLITFSPIFTSPGKGTPVGLEALAEACRACSAPVFALGGVDASNAHQCMEAGAAGIAGIRLFL
jgi:thiamine-phosphate pyrophosphorylase